MNDGLQEFAEQYASALLRYLVEADEAALQCAYELGHGAMAQGRRMLDLAAVHHEALVPALLRAGTPEERARTAKAAAIFFMESLSPFEMTHRGFLEANATLRLVNQTLEQRVQELQIARAAAETAERRSRFLAEASRQLDAALGYRARLAIVARLAVPDLADYCLIDEVEESGKVCRAEVTAADPAKQEFARDLQRRSPPDPDALESASKVLRTGQPEIWPDVSPSQLEALALDAEYLPRLRKLNLRSAMIVPLQARGRTLAVMTLLAAESDRRYGPEDLALAEDFARRAAITLDNARLYDEVQDAAQRKDEYLAMLAHELRNPLAPVANALQLLHLRGGDAVTREHVREVMERQVRHLSRLIDDLLDVSRITRGKILLRYEQRDLAALVRGCVEDDRPALAAAGLTLSLELPDAPVLVIGDPIRLAQIVDNLLSNACKFTEPGGHVSVRLETDAASHWAIVTVRDTGIGIEPETLPRVFDSFIQADRTLDRSRGGLGLGLSVVKGLVEMHGGEVLARSEGLGRGSEFTVRLPWEPEPAPQPVAAATPEAAGSGSRRILVVEDNRDTAESLKELLELFGHEVHVALTGPAGVEAARHLQPEVVLCDLGLPGMDGYAVAAALRREPATAAARLIAITGYGQEEDRRRCREAGFDVHMVKPVDMNVLERLLGGAA